MYTSVRSLKKCYLFQNQTFLSSDSPSEDLTFMQLNCSMFIFKKCKLLIAVELGVSGKLLSQV